MENQSFTCSSLTLEEHLETPTYGLWNLNFDGASRGNPGPSGFGACIRNSIGEVVAIIVSPFPIDTNNILEAHALLAGLILDNQGYFYRLHIEGDSSVIIDACIHRRIISWKLKYVLNQIWRLLDECLDVCILHIYREGNKVADFLSNLGCDGVVSTFHPLPIIEKHKVLKNIFQADMEASTSSASEVFRDC